MYLLPHVFFIWVLLVEETVGQIKILPKKFQLFAIKLITFSIIAIFIIVRQKVFDYKYKKIKKTSVQGVI